MMLKPQLVNNPETFSSSLQQTSNAKGGAPLKEVKTLPATTNQKAQLLHPENARIDNQNCSRICLDQADTVNSSSSKINIPEKLNPPSKCEKQTQAGTITDNLKSESTESTEQLSNLTTANCSVENLSASLNPQNLVNQLMSHNHNQGLMQLQTSGWPMQPQLEAAVFPVQQIHALQSDSVALNGLLPVQDTDEWISHACNSITGMYSRSPEPQPIFGLQEPSTMLSEVINPTLSLPDQAIWDHQLSNLRLSPQVNPLTSLTQQDHSGLNSSGLRDLSDASNTQSEIYSCLNVDVSTGGRNMIDHSVSSAILDEFCTLKDDNFQNPPVCLMNTLSSSQDVQSHSLADSQALSWQDFPDNSGGTSSSNVDFDESSQLQNTSWQPVVPPVRTYTKVQKAGSVGRSIDVTCFNNYDELCSVIEHMFGLERLLNDPRGSEWKLVYVDYENDVLLVGDDPWEEFVGCVLCIRILSPQEVQQMSEEGMKLLNSAALQGIDYTKPKGGRA